VPYLVTGAAGFIGFHACRKLLDRGESVVGVDVVNDYYDPALKEARLAILERFHNFVLHRADVADRNAMENVAAAHSDITRIIHLAAQAGVRYSLVNPYSYTHSNIEGHLVMLELARHLKQCDHFVYASSSSVYGSNRKLPFSVDDRVDQPMSLYAATKRAGELMAHSYSDLYRIPTTGLRFFTVYGPWGRPDSVTYLFVKAILEGKPITVFNHGDMRRNFTYVDDINEGVLAVAASTPARTDVPAKIYNLGNHRSEPLATYISTIEQALGMKAKIEYAPMQAGDIKETLADIQPLIDDFGFEPKTSIDEGVPQFVKWYRDYYVV
jgi:UDP-glucuronate 4-epimerase